MTRDSRPPVLPDNLPVLTDVVDYAEPVDALAEELPLDLPPELSLDEVLPADDTPGGALFGNLPSLDLDVPLEGAPVDAAADGLFEEFRFEAPPALMPDAAPLMADPVAEAAADADEPSPWRQQERAVSSWVANHPAAHFAAAGAAAEAWPAAPAMPAADLAAPDAVTTAPPLDGSVPVLGDDSVWPVAATSSEPGAMLPEQSAGAGDAAPAGSSLTTGGWATERAEAPQTAVPILAQPPAPALPVGEGEVLAAAAASLPPAPGVASPPWAQSGDELVPGAELAAASAPADLLPEPAGVMAVDVPSPCDAEPALPQAAVGPGLAVPTEDGAAAAGGLTPAMWQQDVAASAACLPEAVPTPAAEDEPALVVAPALPAAAGAAVASAAAQMVWPESEPAVLAAPAAAPGHDTRVAVVDEAALLDAIYQRILPRMKVELSLWLQDAIENQTRHLLSGVMQQMKEDYDMLFGETLRESIRQAIADIGRQQEKDH